MNKVLVNLVVGGGLYFPEREQGLAFSDGRRWKGRLSNIMANLLSGF